MASRLCRASSIISSTTVRRRLPLVGAFCFLSLGISNLCPALSLSSLKTGCAQSLSFGPLLRSKFGTKSQVVNMAGNTHTVPSVVVYVTVPNKEAGKKLAESLVKEKLAACVNIVPGDGIKIKGSTSHGNLGIFSLEREIDDIIDIKCEWVRKTGHVMVHIDALSTDVKEADDANSASGIEELKLMVFEPNWSEKQEAITSLNVKYLYIWEFKYEHLTEVDEGALPVQKSYFPM